MAKVFVSYSSHDKKFVDRLASDLDDADISIFYDKWSIPPGGSIVSYIEEGLSESDYLLVILSPASVKSRWVKLELDAALMAGLSDQSIAVIPALLEDCEIPTILRPLRYVDFRDSYGQGLESLLEILRAESSRISNQIATTVPCQKLASLTLGELRGILNKRLKEVEVKSFCFDSRIDFENVEGNTKNEKLMNLLQMLHIRDRVAELLQWLSRERSDICEKPYLDHG